jgi:hypothetical protein
MISAGISVVMAFVYLAIIYRQDHRFPARAVVVVCFLLAIAGVFVASFRVSSPFWRPALLAVGTNSLIAIGFLALFSIGVPLMLAGALALPATASALSEAPRPWGPPVAVLASLAAVCAVFVGLLAT